MTDREKYYRAVLMCVVLTLIAVIGLWITTSKIRSLNEEIEWLLKQPTEDTVHIYRTDTVLIAEPKVEYRYIKYSDTVTICHELRDTVKELVFLPREYVVYKDTSYRAVVSGVQPRLDSLTVYPKTEVLMITKTVKVPDKKRWGAGVQVGAGWNGKEVLPYVGVGVQYNLVRW